MADAATNAMSKLNLATSQPTLIDKRAPGTNGAALELSTNITPITLAQNVNYFKYDIRMYAVFTKRDGSKTTKELTKQTKDDYNEQERKKACSEIFLTLTNSDAMFQGTLIYDRAAVLFTTEKLPPISASEGKLLTLNAQSQSVCPEAKHIEVTIKQAVFGFQVSSNDLAKCVNADFKPQHSKELMEVLNLATSQIPFFTPTDYMTYGNGNIYLLNPGNFGFQRNEAPDIGRDKFTGIGLSKGVKILEGNNQPGCKNYTPALVLDVKKTAFHNFNQNLTEKILQTYGNAVPSHALLARDLKDIRCLTVHKKASIVIGGFTAGPVGKATFKDKDGNAMLICKYYEEKYQLKIARPDLPGVIDAHQRNIYPTDLLVVAPNQRVKINTKDVVEALIKACFTQFKYTGINYYLFQVSAIKPELRFAQTVRLSKLLQLDSKKAQDMGVFVPTDAASLTVPARQLPPVSLLAGQGAMAGPSWRSGGKFVVGAKVEKWAAFLLFPFKCGGKMPRHTPEEVFQSFVQKFADAGNRKGMSIATPLIREHVDVSVGDTNSHVSQAVKKAKEAGCTYVLFVSDERVKSHEQLKYDELAHQITTQEVTLIKASQVAFENKGQTLENIIMKTNVKLRGMNHVTRGDGILECFFEHDLIYFYGVAACVYLPAFSGLHHSNDAIIIGIYIQQPRVMTASEIEGGSQPSFPAVIGLSANNGILQASNLDIAPIPAFILDAPLQQREMAAQQYFTMAYKYANPKEWKKGETQLDTLKKMVAEALMTYKNNRGRVPSKVVIYRAGGVSEGQLSYIASAERDAYLAAFDSLASDYKPTLVIIAASKEHNERFYQKANHSNLFPGVVVDRMAVNPELNEFYLQSHKALQGTAKATKYTLLHESSGRLNSDQVQHMTFALCHLHEIVNSTTAVPTPLYVAEESAKRAVNIYHHMKGPAEYYELDELNAKFTHSNLGARLNA
ncbi:hypothetical protein PRIPAC_70097 [Pristionchus pacificus]|uniref:Uncharacterized protein n=1 Tax=Pristionchus pacificus TaxID=54126 RepID=A0A2A6BFI1_PRIPA|nr:hypothetical protein PRIPAC_70097 [Pristionchus pacificus]|eukprot:PDM64618.1 hypothetical protein PRIPAC_52874 [Pristionchus pacificus]